MSQRMIRVMTHAVITASVGSLVAAALYVGHWHLVGGRIFSVQTNSMVPVFSAGDGVITNKVGTHQLRAGDVISYHDRQNPKVIISHRIISVSKAPLMFITQGDNLQQADIAVNPNQVIGKVTAVAPHYGQFVHRLRTPVGLVIAIYIPSALIIANEVLAYVKRSQRARIYRLYSG